MIEVIKLSKRPAHFINSCMLITKHVGKGMSIDSEVKHGISKNVRGGLVRIISDFTGSFHELSVQNTGNLNGGLSHQGFGLSSTRDRLSLLYGEKAKFEIKQIHPDLVEAKVLIPSQ